MPSALLTPVWVTKKNMKSTVVKDKFVPTNQICHGTFDGKVSLASRLQGGRHLADAQGPTKQVTLRLRSPVNSGGHSRLTSGQR